MQTAYRSKNIEKQSKFGVPAYLSTYMPDHRQEAVGYMMHYMPTTLCHNDKLTNSLCL